jgi:hypothetical protein
VSFVLPPQTVPNRIFPRCSQVGKIEVGIGTRMQAIVALTVVAFEPNPQFGDACIYANVAGQRSPSPRV